VAGAIVAPPSCIAEGRCDGAASTIAAMVDENLKTIIRQMHD
jgi:hypothetical protein